MKTIDRFIDEFHFLSNFADCDIEYEGLKFCSVESAYQAAKTVNLQERMKFCNLTPNKSKALGKRLKIRADWDDIRLSVMETLLRQKFSKSPFRDLLGATKGFELVEGNWWGDRFWGVCNGVGENNLGKLLMKIREEI